MKFIACFILAAATVTTNLSQAQPSSGPLPTYFAQIDPLGSDDVLGFVAVFTAPDGSLVGYTGDVTIPLTLLGNDDSLCANYTNGCGVHIHSGFSCQNATTQGGHYYVDPPITQDPWADARYSFSNPTVASDDGDAAIVFEGTRYIGTDDVEGRAFIVHALDGSRIGCGLLQRVASDELYHSDYAPIAAIADDGDAATGYVTMYSHQDTIYMMGYASGLEPDLVSFTAGGSDCTEPNGCGTHVHAGFSCATSALQMGHLYDSNIEADDPWMTVNYPATSSNGTTWFVHTVPLQGIAELEGRATIVHSNDGTRVSCGLLQRYGGVADADEATSGAPVPNGMAMAQTAGVAMILLLISQL